jgi:predicted nucleotidyltransferase
MDPRNPLRSVTPSVDADVLAVLVRNHAPLTGRRVQQLTERSYAQVRAVLLRLVSEGLVRAEHHGQANTYLLNRSHLLAAPLDMIVGSASTLEASLRDMTQEWDPPPVAIWMYGSFARRDGDATSDIDVLIIRPDSVDEDEERWRAQSNTLTDAIEQQTGNRVQLVELSATEMMDAAASREPLLTSLERDAVVLAGRDPDEAFESLARRN